MFIMLHMFKHMFKHGFITCALNIYLNHVFKYNQEIKVMILSIDEYKNRIALSTKILENHPGEIIENLEEVMKTADARVEQAREKMEKEEQN